MPDAPRRRLRCGRLRASTTRRWGWGAGAGQGVPVGGELFGGSHVERPVGSDRVVELDPLTDDDAGLGDGVERSAVEKLVAHRAVEPLDVAVLLRAGLGHERRGDPLRVEPLDDGSAEENSRPLSERITSGRPSVSKSRSRKTRTLRVPMRAATCTPTQRRVNSSTTLRIRTGRPSTVRTANEVIGPHVTWSDGREVPGGVGIGAGRIVAEALLPRRGHPQPLEPPQPLHPFAVHRPALRDQHRVDRPIPEPRVRLGQRRMSFTNRAS